MSACKLVVRELGTKLLALMLFAACSAAGTEFQHTWKDPEASRLQFKKVLVVVFSADESMRAAVENRIAAKFKRAEGIPSHTLLTKKEIDNPEQAKAKVKASGIDGVITLQVLSAKEKTNYVSGRYYPDPYAFWNYYSYAWPMVYESAFVDASHVVRVETKIFSLVDEKMLWAGVSETSNPNDLRQLVDEVAETTVQALKKQKLM